MIPLVARRRPRAAWRLPVAVAVGVLLAAALSIAPAVGPLAAAREAAPASAGVRWSVVPSDGRGPDGRSAVEVGVRPGQTVEDHIAVRNASDAAVTFRLAPADGFTSASGRFDVRAEGESSVDAGSWISLPARVTVPAGATVVVPFSIAAPSGAAPGDHSAGITASVLSTARVDGGASVGVDTRVGVRVLARVAGQLSPAASLHGGGGSYAVAWNPLRPGSAIVSFDVVNDGNTRLLASGTVSAAGQDTPFPAAGEPVIDLLPGDRRTVRVVVDDLWPSILVPVDVILRPRGITIDGQTPIAAASSLQTSLWAMPISQLIVLTGAALLIFAALWGRQRSPRRTDRLVADAHEHDRPPAAAALTEESTSA